MENSGHFGHSFRVIPDGGFLPLFVSPELTQKSQMCKAEDSSKGLFGKTAYLFVKRCFIA